MGLSLKGPPASIFAHEGIDNVLALVLVKSLFDKGCYDLVENFVHGPTVTGFPGPCLH